jgi:hypothetical protein
MLKIRDKKPKVTVKANGADLIDGWRTTVTCQKNLIVATSGDSLT